VVGIVTISRDITESKRAQEELLSSETRERARANELAAIMDALPLTAFISRDPDCSEVLGNRRAYETLRLRPGANLSKSAPCPNAPSFRISRDGIDVPPEDLPMQVAARTQRPVEHNACDFILADGTRRNMLGNAVPLCNDKTTTASREVR
jgi:PAS domain-containing protein